MKLGLRSNPWHGIRYVYCPRRPHARHNHPRPASTLHVNLDVVADAAVSHLVVDTTHAIGEGDPVTRAAARSGALPAPVLLAVLRCQQEKGYAPVWAICGIAPSCCIMPRSSSLTQLSTNFPSLMRSISIPVKLTCLPVGGMPMKSPWWVPRKV